MKLGSRLESAAGSIKKILLQYCIYSFTMKRGVNVDVQTKNRKRSLERMMMMMMMMEIIVGSPGCTATSGPIVGGQPLGLPVRLNHP